MIKAMNRYIYSANRNKYHSKTYLCVFFVVDDDFIDAVGIYFFNTIFNKKKIYWID
jgi:hypothetical protein